MYSRSEVDKLTFTGRYGDSKPKTIVELTVKNHEEGESFILFFGCSTNTGSSTNSVGESNVTPN